MISLKLPNVTLVAIGSTDIMGNICALKHSCSEVEFGAVKFITSAMTISSWLAWNTPIKVEEINPISSIDQWNYEVIYSLPSYIDTPFALLVHPDGFVVNPASWRDEFLDYDYIGAPWPLPIDDFSYRDITGEIIRVGNSVSLRSKRLMDLAPQQNLEWKAFHGFTNEDGFITVNYRHKYLEAGMKFAPIEVAKHFSREVEIPENADVESPFCFHKHAGRNKDYPNFEEAQVYMAKL